MLLPRRHLPRRLQNRRPSLLRLRYAEGGLLVAEHEMQTPSPVYHTVCFLCQSAAEKFLKGFLISRGWSLEKTHDIVELLGWFRYRNFGQPDDEDENSEILSRH